ncbi:MAG: hypothetical protein AAF958_19565, partial [Planctomycetota bacterium]
PASQPATQKPSRPNHNGTSLLWGWASAMGSISPLAWECVMRLHGITRLQGEGNTAETENLRTLPLETPHQPNGCLHPSLSRKEMEEAWERLVDRLADPGMPSASDLIELNVWSAASRQLASFLGEDLIHSLHETVIRLAAVLDSDVPQSIWLDEAVLHLDRRPPGAAGQVTARLRSRVEGGMLVQHAIEDIAWSRAFLASWLRLRPCLKVKKVHAKATGALSELFTWILAHTRHDGTMVFATPVQTADRFENGETNGTIAIRDPDAMPGGLLEHAALLDIDCFGPALKATLGQQKTGGKLAWQVHLPETMLDDPNAKRSALLPEWDVRRSRCYIDYRGDQQNVEILGGKRTLIAGSLETQISIDGHSIHPAGAWEAVCEYTDDEVHLIEYEQPWSAGVRLQRQFMQLREDRVLMIADAVLDRRADARPAAIDSAAMDSAKIASADHLRAIEHSVCLALGRGNSNHANALPENSQAAIQAIAEPATREWLLTQSDRPQGIMIPLAASEWQGERTRSRIDLDGGKLCWSSTGKGRLYSPLWLDLQRRRISRPRTWRPLTVGENLCVVADHDARAFRIQSGSNHWVVYRSLSPSRLRTVLGKHMNCQFVATRFDPGDGVHDDLVTVDDDE